MSGIRSRGELLVIAILAVGVIGLVVYGAALLIESGGGPPKISNDAYDFKDPVTSGCASTAVDVSGSLTVLSSRASHRAVGIVILERSTRCNSFWVKVDLLLSLDGVLRVDLIRRGSHGRPAKFSTRHLRGRPLLSQMLSGGESCVYARVRLRVNGHLAYDARTPCERQPNTGQGTPPAGPLTCALAPEALNAAGWAMRRPAPWALLQSTF